MGQNGLPVGVSGGYEELFNMLEAIEAGLPYHNHLLFCGYFAYMYSIAFPVHATSDLTHSDHDVQINGRYIVHKECMAYSTSSRNCTEKQTQAAVIIMISISVARCRS